MSYKVGDMVSWNSSGGRAKGKIVEVVREGVLKVPNTKFKVNAEPNDPAVLIQIFRNDEETKTFVGHKMSTVSKTLLEKHQPGKHDQSMHGKGGTGGGAGGGGNLSGEQNKQVNELAIDLFNHVQSRPVRSGPKLDQWRERGKKIVSQASTILKLPQDKTLNELRSRMGE